CKQIGAIVMSMTDRARHAQLQQLFEEIKNVVERKAVEKWVPFALTCWEYLQQAYWGVPEFSHDDKFVSLYHYDAPVMSKFIDAEAYAEHMDSIDDARFRVIPLYQEDQLVDETWRKICQPLSWGIYRQEWNYILLQMNAPETPRSKALYVLHLAGDAWHAYQKNRVYTNQYDEPTALRETVKCWEMKLGILWVLGGAEYRETVIKLALQMLRTRQSNLTAREAEDRLKPGRKRLGSLLNNILGTPPGPMNETVATSRYNLTHIHPSFLAMDLACRDPEKATKAKCRYIQHHTSSKKGFADR
ncbi:MAG: hypothetical protein ACREQV_13875, partial [Candidatus Binatia bacterium]